MVGIDLFAGAGGMSVGAIAAGVTVKLAVEADPHAALTYGHNHPHTEIFPNDIRQLGSSQLRGVPRGKGTVVFGGPPCQGFSYSNQRTRSVDNPNNWLFTEFLRVVKVWMPDWVVFENVKGITNTEGGLFLARVREGLSGLRYTLSEHLLNAVDFGVPQNRARLFLIGSRHGLKISIRPRNNTGAITVFDAIADLPELENGAAVDRLKYRQPARSQYARQMRKGSRVCVNHLVTRSAAHILARYRFVLPGGNWEDIPKRLMRNYADRSRCHTGIYHRLDGTKPSIVIGNFRKNMLIHPTEHRGLSVREAARIQSFPDLFEFKGSIGFQQQQVGNAVPPILAQAVFASILNHGK